jgi:indole-3-glycerol phosphate synthase
MLDKIVARKTEEIEQKKRMVPLSYLREEISRQRPSLDFAAALQGENIKLIAEIKRASPSKGLLRSDFDPIKLAQTYASGGVAAISVVTEANYFLGSIDHLEAIRKAVRLPLLRKDFIFDPYQIYESRACGADALLLIATILSRDQLRDFISLSHDLGLKCLVEVHTEEEVEKSLLSEAEIIGINNRDLRTFAVDLETTNRLRPLIPRDKIVVSESGIKHRRDLERLKSCGVNAALVGEALITANRIAAKIRELTGKA